MFQRFRRDVATVLGSLVMALQLTACGIDNDNDQSGDSAVAPAATTIITGSVGDGPIVGATLSIFDRDGNLLQTELSDSGASYSARIKAKGNAYPLTIATSDGVDLVTGRAPDFRLTSVVTHPSVKSVNINPFTTLIVESARSMPGGLSEQNIAAARHHVMQQLNFGLDPRSIPDCPGAGAPLPPDARTEPVLQLRAGRPRPVGDGRPLVADRRPQAGRRVGRDGR